MHNLPRRSLRQPGFDIRERRACRLIPSGHTQPVPRISREELHHRNLYPQRQHHSPRPSPGRGPGQLGRGRLPGSTGPWAWIQLDGTQCPQEFRQNRLAHLVVLLWSCGCGNTHERPHDFWRLRCVKSVRRQFRTLIRGAQIRLPVPAHCHGYGYGPQLPQWHAY